MEWPRKTVLASLLAAALCAPSQAAEPLVTFKALAPGVALELAQAAMAACRDQGYQVAVAVVDRMGVMQVMLRDRYAGAHTPETARRMAWTAVSFRSDTRRLANETNVEMSLSGARFIDDVLFFGGGVPVSASGSIVAGVGVSGGPSGDANHACAEAGIAAVAARLELSE